MSPTTESPINKVIFLQKIFRFAGRNVKDLVIINSVCKYFEETMQAHHTFNLLLYDNIIKKQTDEYGFLKRSVGFLATAPAWIVYQWTTVNEHDEVQRELLEDFLLYQAEYYDNKILIRDPSLVKDEVPSTTRELFCHILDSCIKLGIANEVLELCTKHKRVVVATNEESRSGWNCIMHAVSRKISADFLALLIESCVQHGLDVKKMLEQETRAHWNCILVASYFRLPVDSFKVLLGSCVGHGVDMKKVLEQKSGDRNCVMLAASSQCHFDSFNLLIESCVEHGVDMKKLLEHKEHCGKNCIMLAAENQLATDSLQLLIESCVRHGVNMKKILEETELNIYNCIMQGVSKKISFDSLKLLIESCIEYDVDMKKLLEQKDFDGLNCILVAARFQCPIDSFTLLIETCLQHGVDMKEMLEHTDRLGRNCIMIASIFGLPSDSFKLLIAHFPSNESFQTMLSAKNGHQQKRAVEYAKTEEIRTLLEDPDCWQKCREWRKQQQVL